MKFLSFYHKDGSGLPAISRDHARLSAEDAANLLRYLDGAPMLRRITAMDPDLLATTNAPRVRQSIYTDGVWIWGEDVPYYVKHYRLDPGDEFMKHCSGAGFVCRQPTFEQKQAAEIAIGSTPTPL